MKNLMDYVQDKQTMAFDKAGAFFCFGQEQFDKKKKEGVQYVSVGAGLVCPKDTVKVLAKELEEITSGGIAKDIKENGKDAIILRELINHESFYTCDITQTSEYLEEYGITEKEVMDIYKKEYLNNIEE